MTDLERARDRVAECLRTQWPEDATEMLAALIAAAKAEALKQCWGNPCNRHTNVAAWVARVKKDEEGLHCFGCFIESRERAAKAEQQEADSADEIRPE